MPKYLLIEIEKFMDDIERKCILDDGYCEKWLKKYLNEISMESPTTGDMIQKIIPIEDMWRGYSTERGKQVCVRFAHAEYVTCFDADYWDAPYKAEIEPQESEDKE